MSRMREAVAVRLIVSVVPSTDPNNVAPAKLVRRQEVDWARREPGPVRI